MDVSGACEPLAKWNLRDDLDSRGAILFRRFAGGGANIFSQPLSGGEPKPVTNFKSGAIASFDRAPGGKLVITGGEALYADMGHFGRKPVAIAWLVLVWPALLINYFGQGALLLTHRHLANASIGQLGEIECVEQCVGPGGVLRLGAVWMLVRLPDTERGGARHLMKVMWRRMRMNVRGVRGVGEEVEFMVSMIPVPPRPHHRELPLGDP